MAKSLQDQLLKAGLADARQARKARAEKAPKKGKHKGRNDPVPSEAAVAAQQAMAQQAARDTELNRRRDAAAARKAQTAQIRQIIDQSHLPLDENGEGYHFADEGKVRTLRVTHAMREALVTGSLEIVRQDGRYHVVPAEAAVKIRARDPACVVARPAPGPAPAAEDPYADYPVPDDLMW